GDAALLTVEERKNRAGMADVWSACNQIGAQFELVSYREGDSHEEHFANLMGAVDKVVECGADAVMIPFLKITDDKFPVFLRKLVSHHIASFSQEGEFHVSRGILLGLGEDSLEPYGMFEAGVIERVLVGETPRGIDQRFLPAHRWLINLRTGIQLGWKPPFGLILTAGKIYSTQSPLLPR
ncbi:MAG: hypothetical protein HUK26_09625, partial [Duodenibacillus sp.]|nr:hypothetical protein [Duodenibacillus sp.]